MIGRGQSIEKVCTAASSIHMSSSGTTRTSNREHSRFSPAPSLLSEFMRARYCRVGWIVVKLICLNKSRQEILPRACKASLGVQGSQDRPATRVFPKCCCCGLHGPTSSVASMKRAMQPELSAASWLKGETTKSSQSEKMGRPCRPVLSALD